MIWNLPPDVILTFPLIFVCLFYQNLAADSGLLPPAVYPMAQVSILIGLLVCVVGLVWSSVALGLSAPIKMLVFIFPALFAGAIGERMIGRGGCAMLAFVLWPISAFVLFSALAAS